MITRNERHSPPYLLGIDSGLTVTKAVLYDADGREVGSGTVRVSQETPHPRWVERDMNRLWQHCCQAIHAALQQSGIQPQDIVGIAATGHGDGIYLVDDQLQPIRPGILSLDTRAWTVLKDWKVRGILDQALPLTGQFPYAAAPAALLAWFKVHEPDTYARIRWFLMCKDWIKLKLTGIVAADPTEASESFTDVRTQAYSAETFRLYDLRELEDKAPPIVNSGEVIGSVTEQAAAETGLLAGTPVVSGIHDVDACAIGTGCTGAGRLSMTAGTFSINQVVSTAPVIDERWACRNFVSRGAWMNMSISPASATNLDWLLDTFCKAEVEAAQQSGRSPYSFVNDEIESVLHEDSSVFFLPFIFGSPYGNEASATFFGLRGWHGRAHVLRAVFEGVAFNHRTHIDALRSAFRVNEVRVSGGGARSLIWTQLFADVFGLPVVITDAAEAGALGAAICAGLGARVYETLDDAIARTVRTTRIHEPETARRQQLELAYQTYNTLIEALKPVWRSVENRPADQTMLPH